MAKDKTSRVLRSVAAVVLATTAITFHSNSAEASPPVPLCYFVVGVGNTPLANNGVAFASFYMPGYTVIGNMFNNGNITGGEFYLDQNAGRYYYPNEVAAVRNEAGWTQTVAGAFVVEYTNC